MTERVQSLERGIDVLMTLIQGPKTLTEVIRETDLPKGTAFRILASLSHENLVVRNVGAGFMLGPGCLRLIDAVMTGGFGTIIGVGRTAVEQLWKTSGETVSVHVKIGTERVCIEELPSAASVRYISAVGSAAPLHVGAAGRLLLAFASADDRERTLDRLVAAGAGFDREALRAELEVIRARAYELSTGERVAGAAAISVPIRGRRGFVASLSVIGPDFRLSDETRLALLPELRGAAEAIGLALDNAAHSTPDDTKGSSA